jgi:hypothetical protein
LDGAGKDVVLGQSPQVRQLSALPPGYGPGQRDELGDVIVPGAPVIEGEEPVAHLALAGDGAGHPRPQVQYVTQFLLGDPGGGDLLAVPVAVQGVDDLVELGG